MELNNMDIEMRKNVNNKIVFPIRGPLNYEYGILNSLTIPIAKYQKDINVQVKPITLFLYNINVYL